LVTGSSPARPTSESQMRSLSRCLTARLNSSGDRASGCCGSSKSRICRTRPLGSSDITQAAADGPPVGLLDESISSVSAQLDPALVRPGWPATRPKASLVAAPVRSAAPVRRHPSLMSSLDHPEAGGDRSGIDRSGLACHGCGPMGQWVPMGCGRVAPAHCCAGAPQNRASGFPRTRLKQAPRALRVPPASP
jgi:hypothetical protein